MEFSKRNIILNSWQALQGQLGLWILLMLFIFCLNIVIGAVQERLLDDVTIQTILFTVAAYLFQAGLNLGMIKIALNIHEDKSVGFNQIFENFHVLVTYISATIVFLALLILVASPGIILLMLSISADIYSISRIY